MLDEVTEAPPVIIHPLALLDFTSTPQSIVTDAPFDALKAPDALGSRTYTQDVGTDPTIAAVALARTVVTEGPSIWIRPPCTLRCTLTEIAGTDDAALSETPDTVAGKLTVTVSLAVAPNPLRRA
jgi:hypothetical protein